MYRFRRDGRAPVHRDLEIATVLVRSFSPSRRSWVSMFCSFARKAGVDSQASCASPASNMGYPVTGEPMVTSSSELTEMTPRRTCPILSSTATCTSSIRCTFPTPTASGIDRAARRSARPISWAMSSTRTASARACSSSPTPATASTTVACGPRSRETPGATRASRWCATTRRGKSCRICRDRASSAPPSTWRCWASTSIATSARCWNAQAVLWDTPRRLLGFD